MESNTQPKFRKDYRPPDYLVDQVDLAFSLDAEETMVTAELDIRRAEHAEADAPLILDGETLELIEIAIDDEPLADNRWTQSDAQLEISDVPDRFRLKTLCRIHPADNTALEGLYVSSDVLTTQCEAHGFRRITFYPDRPDVLARFTVRLEADRARYPVLLSNGNRVAEGPLDDKRHFVTWEDPFPKPCYLFALVAGDLKELRREHLRPSGKPVVLSAWAPEELISRSHHALNALEQAMAWDESTYGLECDVDQYSIVSVPEFNMGAMENKGLNIFNEACMLVDPELSTDADYERVLAVVAHEYFHNWTGNRVTCRDWFQLSLKESLTVFREQQFMEDSLSAGVQRIQNVRMLRSLQFPEDSGPLAHPVRPESYVEMNNFYTLTIYEKGAEVIRMLHTLVGWTDFRAGVRNYLDTHDGSAATIDDFIAAIAEASGRDLSQFERWYSQSGTPVVRVSESFDPSARRLALSFEQELAPTPDQPDKAPMQIPLRYSVHDADAMSTLPMTQPAGLVDGVFELTEQQQSLVLDEISGRPVVSLLGGFSAPVKLKRPLRVSQVRTMIALDRDPFTRWEGLQTLYLRYLDEEMDGTAPEDRSVELGDLVSTVRQCIEHADIDPALLAEMLTVPDEAELADRCAEPDIDALCAARDGLKQHLADALHEHWLELMEQSANSGAYRFDAAEVGRRALRRVAMQYRVLSGGEEGQEEVERAFVDADNMTDQMNALVALNGVDCAARIRCLERFATHWADERLVMDKWFALRASAPLSDVPKQVSELLHHPLFDHGNPNRVRALLGSFSRNLRGFHAADGSGYRLIARQIVQLDAINPQIAARLVAAFTIWRRLDEDRRHLANIELEAISAQRELSPDVQEMLDRSLAAH